MKIQHMNEKCTPAESVCHSLSLKYQECLNFVEKVSNNSRTKLWFVYMTE